MELPDKVINNLAALAGAFLIGQKADFNARVMADLWKEIADAQAYLEAKKQGQKVEDPSENDRP